MPKGRTTTTLARKILWAVLPVVVVALLGVGFSNYFVAAQQITKEIDTNLHSQAKQLSNNLNFFFEQNRRDLQSLTEMEALRAYFQNVDFKLYDEAGTYRGEVEDYSKLFTSRTPRYTGIFYFDGDLKWIAGVDHGSVIKVDNGHPLNKKYLFASLGLARPKGQDGWKSPIQSDSRSTWIRFAAPVFDDAGKRRGVVVLTCDLQNVTDDLSQAGLGEHGRAYITDASGKAILGAPSGNGSALRQIVTIGTSAWKVNVEADPQEFLLPLVWVRTISLSFLALVAVLSPVFLAMVVNRATRPIADLVAGTQKLAAGDLDYRFPLPPIRELGVLAESFNDMGEKLQLRETDLRWRIRQLTALRHMETTVIQRLKEEAILRSCLDSVVAGLGFDRIRLYWVDEQQKYIEGRFLHQTQPDETAERDFRRSRVPVGESGILNQVLRTHEAALVRNLSDASDLVPANAPQGSKCEFVLAPIRGKDRVFGVITADNLNTGRHLAEADRDGLMLFAGAAGLALDNTQLFDRLSVSEARHRLVLDNSPVAILGLGQDFAINTWNRGAETVFGYTAEEVLGKPVNFLFATHPDDFTKLANQVAEVGGVREYAIAGATKSGQPLDLTLSWDGSRPEGAPHKEWAVVIRDVTEAKKMQRQLIFSEKLSAVGQLISGIAHELNNPLQAVVGYAEILTVPRPPGSELPVREMKHIFDNATRCRKIIDNLLLFVRQGGVKKSTIKIQDVIRASLELLQHKIRKTAGVEVQTELPEEPLYAMANFQQIEQVIVNIVNNACDAMEGWEGPKKMRITAKKVDQSIRITLADTGPGIPADVCARIFEPFFTTKPEGRGTGLGLPVCRQIVGEHGGELRVQTQVGAGTTFSFELQFVQPEPVAAPAPDAAGPAPELPTCQGSILVIEDEAAIRELLEEVLRAAGHRVHSAPSLQAAESLVSHETFDMVVSDVQLDDGTGVDLFHAWPNLTTHTRPPFLFLSGDILAGAVGEAAQQDDVYMLQKPINLTELNSQINAILVKHQSQTV